MGSKLLGHIRHNTVAYAAVVLVFVLAPTSAYATHLVVRSSDIVNGEVKTADLANDSVRSAKILNGTILRVDLATDSVDSAKVKNNTLAGWDVADESLSGADILESTLGQVPTALQGGLGRSGVVGSCDPETTTFVICSTVQITLDKPARLLVTGTANARTEHDSDHAWGECRIGTTSGPIEESRTRVGLTDSGLGTFWFQAVPLQAVTNVFPAGTHTVGIDCMQDNTGAIQYEQVRVSVVALSAS
jgi:hypothetical protein